MLKLFKYSNTSLPTEIVQVNDGEALQCQIKSLLCTKFSNIYSYTKNISIIQIEVAQVCLTITSYEVKNAQNLKTIF